MYFNRLETVPLTTHNSLPSFPFLIVSLLSVCWQVEGWLNPMSVGKRYFLGPVSIENIYTRTVKGPN